MFTRIQIRRLKRPRLRIEALEDRCVPSGYAVQQFDDPMNGNHEYRLYFDEFHFATLLRTPPGLVKFRGHPDLDEPNGWGSSDDWGAFIAGVDPLGARIEQVQATANGVQAGASGKVQSPHGE